MGREMVLYGVVLIFLSPSWCLAQDEYDLTYRGQPLRHWLKALQSSDQANRLKASRVLHEVGPEAKEAVPALLMAFKNEDALVRSRVALALARVGPPAVPALMVGLKMTDQRVRYEACGVLGALGTQARSAHKPLHRLLADRDAFLRIRAARSFWRITRDSKPILPVLKKALQSSDSLEQQSAAYAVVDLGPAADSLVPEVTALLINQSDWVRDAAFRALRAIGVSAVPHLSKSLASDKVRLRVEAAEALGSLGPEAEPAVDVLCDALRDQATGPRVAAARALGRIGLASDRVLKALRHATQDQERDVRWEAVIALGALARVNRSSRVQAAIPEMRKALSDANDGIRRAAGQALGEVGKPAVPTLRRALGDKDLFVRRQAIRALGQMGVDAEQAIPDLHRLFGEVEGVTRLRLVDALAQMGPKAVDVLRKAAGEGDARLKARAIRALGRLGPGGRSAVSILVGALIDEDLSVRVAVLRSLRQTGVDDSSAVPAVVRQLADRSEEVRLEALRTLSVIGADSREVVAGLRRVLSDGEATVREQAALTAGRLGSSMQATTPELLRLQHDPNKSVRRAACRALVQVGSARQALPAWKKMLESKDWALRETAAYGLGWSGLSTDDLQKEVLPALRKALEDTDYDVQLMAAWALLEVQGEANGSTDVLPVLLKGVESEFHRRASPLLYRLLARLGPRASKAVPSLVTVLREEPSLLLKLQVVRALEHMGPEAHPTVPALLRLFPGLSSFWRQQVTKAYDARTLNTSPNLRDALALADRDQQEQILKALVRSGHLELEEGKGLEVALSAVVQGYEDEVFRALKAMGSAAVPHLVRGLKEPETDVRAAAAQALGDLGSSAPKEVGPALQAALSDPEGLVRVEVARALYRVEKLPPERVKKELIPVLVGVLDEGKELSTGRALQALKEIGQNVPLSGVLNHPSWTVRVLAVRALGRMNSREKQSHKALQLRLRDRHPAVRVEAASALARMDPKMDVLPVLKHGLRNRQSALTRRLAALALEKRGIVGSEAQLALHNALNDNRIHVRFHAALALVKITGSEGSKGPSKTPSAAFRLAPLLARMVSEEGVRLPVRVQAVDLLGELGKSAESVSTILEVVFREPETPQRLRAAVEKVLKKLDSRKAK